MPVDVVTKTGQDDALGGAHRQGARTPFPTNLSRGDQGAKPDLVRGWRGRRTLEAFLCQQRLPVRRSQERAVGTKGIAHEVPPPLRKAKHYVVASLLLTELTNHEQSALRKRAGTATNRLGDVGRGVQHVRGQHHVEAPLRDPLSLEILFQV